MQAHDKPGEIAEWLLRCDLVILGELGYPPYSSNSILLFHLLSKIYENTIVVITTNLSFLEWAGTLGGTKMITALLVWPTHHYHFIETESQGRSSSLGPPSLKKKRQNYKLIKMVILRRDWL